MHMLQMCGPGDGCYWAELQARATPITLKTQLVTDASRWLEITPCHREYATTSEHEHLITYISFPSTHQNNNNNQAAAEEEERNDYATRFRETRFVANLRILARFKRHLGLRL